MTAPWMTTQRLPVRKDNCMLTILRSRRLQEGRPGISSTHLDSCWPSSVIDMIRYSVLGGVLSSARLVVLQAEPCLAPGLPTHVRQPTEHSAICTNDSIKECALNLAYRFCDREGCLGCAASLPYDTVGKRRDNHNLPTM